jgi:HEAT repeat protein
MTLFQEQELSTRMGVLVIMEGALDKNPQSVKNMVPALIELLYHEDARIRGDIADFLGGVGDSRAIPHLEILTKDADPDVAEAAEDALEELQDSLGDR